MRIVRLLPLAAALVCAPLSTFVVHAQDTRHVTEPVISPPCATLDAHLASHHAQLAADDESKLDTERIQMALDHCSAGHSVVLRVANGDDAFLSGPIQLREGVALVVDRGATLFASRDPALYARSPGSCGLVNHAPPGCRPLISVDHVSGAGVMGDGTIDGRGGDPLLGQNVTWWQLAEQARSGGHQQVFRLIVANYADNFTLYRITLKNSPNFHVVYDHGDGFTVWGLKIDTPQRGARNTDGVDPGDGARNITITHSYIRDGDDNVALKGGEGGITDVSIIHNHFYWGHGMSIGSETFGGVSRIRVEDLSLDGPDNGIRIKSNASRGGLVEDVVYDNVCIRNSPNPLFFDTGYTAAGTLQGDRYPTYKDITLRNVAISGGGKISFNGYSADHRIGVHLDNVTVNPSDPYQYSIRHADFHIGPGPMNLTLLGEDSTVTGKVTSKARPPDCSAMFVPFPQ
ncbi:MAG: glycosyl hydrolase family 28 protein [Acidobacteriaceae bacterium]